jgi:integrase
MSPRSVSIFMPLLGSLSLARLDVEALDSFYAGLRRCRDHCDRRPHLQHRTSGEHRCDEHVGTPCAPPNPAGCRACARACKRHVCRGLSDSTVRQVHWIISVALDRAVVWKWVASNPAQQADKPPLPHPDPKPPSPEEAARLVERAWSQDPDWGAFVWVKMTTGMRRGEICGLRWSHLDLDQAVQTIRRTVFVGQRGGLQEKDTKTHQQRRVVLDPETAAVLRDHHARAQARAAAVGEPLNPDAFRVLGRAGQSAAVQPGHGDPALPADGDTPRHQHDAEEPAALHRNRADQWRRGRADRRRQARPRGRGSDHAQGLRRLDIGG